MIAKEYYGDAAVKYTNENNVVEDNYPMDIDMIVSAEPIFVGQDAEITISALENFNGIVTVLELQNLSELLPKKSQHSCR